MWASAVIYLNIQPSDAWKLTPRHFWILWDMHLEKMEKATGNSYTKPMSMDEFNELNDYLDSIHGNN